MIVPTSGHSTIGGVLQMRTLQKTALVLTIIGALNWGLVGIFHFDVVAQLAGGPKETLSRFIYIVIGIAGLLNLGLLFNDVRDHEVVKVTESRSE